MPQLAGHNLTQPNHPRQHPNPPRGRRPSQRHPPPIHYAQFSTLTTIITAHEACWQALGYSSDHKASSQLHDIVELRNDVAHSTPLIQNTNRGLTETGRTITDLQEHHHHIQTLLTN